jgi:hypothetical protein
MLGQGLEARHDFKIATEGFDVSPQRRKPVVPPPLEE